MFSGTLYFLTMSLYFSYDLLPAMYTTCIENSRLSSNFRPGVIARHILRVLFGPVDPDVRKLIPARLQTSSTSSIHASTKDPAFAVRI